MQGIPPVFLTHASEILGETYSGLTGPQIVKNTAGYAAQYDVQLPHPTYPFDAPNKRTALLENLQAFKPHQQYLIIKDLCNYLLNRDPDLEEVRKLKVQLITRYSHLDDSDLASEIDGALVEKTQHWLADYGTALALYKDTLHKYEHGEFNRNLLDDLRLALETLLRSLLGNNKSLENQIPSLGSFIKDRGGSPELQNMFVRLVKYYANYQNEYVKHNDAVIEEEVEFIMELTSSLMKYVVRVGTQSPVQKQKF